MRGGIKGVIWMVLDSDAPLISRNFTPGLMRCSLSAHAKCNVIEYAVFEMFHVYTRILMLIWLSIWNMETYDVDYQKGGPNRISHLSETPDLSAEKERQIQSIVN